MSDKTNDKSTKSSQQESSELNLVKKIIKQTSFFKQDVYGRFLNLLYEFLHNPSLTTIVPAVSEFINYR